MRLRKLAAGTLQRVYWRFPRAGRAVQRAGLIPAAVRLANDPVRSRTYFPAEPRKAPLRIAAEHVYWAMRNGELCENYFAYGMDRVGRRITDIIGYDQFRRIRDHHNRMIVRTTGFDYVCLLRDKFVFAQIAQSLGIPTPRVLAFLEHNAVRWPPSAATEPLDTLSHRDLEGFCKPFAGIEGMGAFALSIRQGALRIDSRPASLADLRARLAGRFLLQERIVQHPDLARLHPTSVNTLRVVTVRSGERASVFLVCLRIGSGGRSVDNFAAGGVLVSVDPSTGRLHRQGVIRARRLEWIGAHPDTGVSFEGYQLPYFHDALEMVRSFHDSIRYVHSIGWDVAFTPEGVTVIEGNDNWGARNLMVLEPDFTERFQALFHLSAAGGSQH